MDIAIILAFITYFSILFLIGFFALKKSMQSSDFILGSRSINYWVTAISVQASDMSGWLFMGYPAMVYAHGASKAWIALGLMVGMFLTWHFVAYQLRVATEKYNSKTLSSFFESRFSDTSGLIRIISAVFCLVFFTFYISASLVELGLLFKSLLGLSYHLGVTIGVVVVFYTLFGGFTSMAWIDFFQGLFLLAMLMIVPCIALGRLGGWGVIAYAAQVKGVSLSLLPYSFESLRDIIFISLEWGLGYFGLPHILTKFMGIDDASKIRQAKYLGLTWQVLALSSATLVGLVGIAYFPAGAVDSQLIFINMVKDLFTPFFAGFILCAIVAAAINVIGAQILVSASIIAEDFYKKFKKMSEHRDVVHEQKQVLWFSRGAVLVICLLAYGSAFTTSDTIFNLVKYAWSGLGCTFGPLVLVSLHTRTTNRYVALTGIIVGGLTGAFWPHFGSTVPAMIAGYVASFSCMGLVAWLVPQKK